MQEQINFLWPSNPVCFTGLSIMNFDPFIDRNCTNSCVQNFIKCLTDPLYIY